MSPAAGPTSPAVHRGAVSACGIVLLVAAVAAAVIWLRPTPPGPTSPAPTLTAAPTPSSKQPAPVTSPSEPASLSTATGTPTTPTPHSEHLHGRALAVAWLNGYLTRSDRDDEDWSREISSITTPELVDQLKALGSDNVGLPELKSWRVTKITGYDPPNKPVDTPSRQVLTYIATVTDGRTKIDKPFELYSYLAEDGTWVVTSIEQPFITAE